MDAPLAGVVPVAPTIFHDDETVDLDGTGNGLPLVEFHGIPPLPGRGALPEILSVNLTDLLAARASGYLFAALKGEPEALRAVEQEAERLLETEDIQRVV